jgi:hypothetical protein
MQWRFAAAVYYHMVITAIISRSDDSLRALCGDFPAPKPPKLKNNPQTQPVLYQLLTLVEGCLDCALSAMQIQALA